MRIYLAGHNGMVGSAILRRLMMRGDHDIITADRAQLDLTDAHATQSFINAKRPDLVILAAARVGGIAANDRYPAAFITENLQIATNVITAARRAGVTRLLQFGSSCIYPRETQQPITEDALLSGQLERTNAPYAIAKIAAIQLCDACNRQYGTDYRSLMPTNLYGPRDNFHLEDAHVLPALLRRFHEAAHRGETQIRIWGSGTPRREFLHVDDLADAAMHFLSVSKPVVQAHTRPGQSHINVGTGRDITIRSLAELIAQITGFRGRISYDLSKPDGTPRKLLDTSKLTRLGWQSKIGLREGVQATYDWYRAQSDAGLMLRGT